MERLQLTRQEIELRLERGLTNKILQFETVEAKKVTGKLQRLAVNVVRGEILVVFQLDKIRYEVDLQYFVENTILLNGDPNRTTDGDIRWVLKNDR